MIVYATPEFIAEYNKLSKNNSYKDFTQDILGSYFGKEFKDCLSGRRLNGNSKNPFIKKRISGSGGGRLYLVAIISEESIYFTFLSPKTGSLGSDNLTDDKITGLLNNVYICIENSNLFIVSPSEDNKELVFTKVTDESEKSKEYISEEIRYYYEYEVQYNWHQTSDSEISFQIGNLLMEKQVQLKDVYPKRDFTPEVYYKDENISNTSTFIVENKIITDDAFSQDNIDSCIASLQSNLYRLEHEWEDHKFNKKYFVLEYKEKDK